MITGTMNEEYTTLKEHLLGFGSYNDVVNMVDYLLSNKVGGLLGHVSILMAVTAFKILSKAFIKSVAYYIPKENFSNELVLDLPDNQKNKIIKKLV